MNTTSLLVDILIIGIQVLLWISTFTVSFLNMTKGIISFAEKCPSIFIILIILTSYTLGIVFDYIIANFFDIFKSKLEKKTYKKGLVIRILSYDKELHKFLDSQYARLRIARATVFNLPLITISICTYILLNNIKIENSTCLAVFLVFTFGIILTAFAFFGWIKRNKVYWGYIEETVKLIEK